MQTRSLRFRLTIWYTAVLTAGLALFGTLLWLSLRQQLNADLERDLDGRAARRPAILMSAAPEASRFATRLDQRPNREASACWSGNSA